MSKRLLFIIIGLLVVLGALVAVFFFLSPDTTTPTDDNGIPIEDGQLQPPEDAVPNDGTDGGGEVQPPESIPVTESSFGTEEGSPSSLPLLARLTDDPIKALRVTLSADGTKLWYFDKDEKKFYQTNFDGNNAKIFGQIPEAFEDVADVNWAPTRRSFILEQLDDDFAFNKKTFTTIETNESTELDARIDDFAFSPDGSKIYYQFVDVENNIITLNISDDDGQNFRVIKEFPIKNLQLGWIPEVDKLMFNLTPSGYRRSTFYIHDEDGENVLSLMEKGYGVEGIWSPKGTRILATWARTNSNKLHLRAVSVKSTELRDMSDIKTFIDKCVWSQDPVEDVFVYCAVPRNISGNAVLPDDYYAGKLKIVDDFYKINTKTGEKFLIAESTDEFKIDAKDLFLLRGSDHDEVIYFSNRSDDNNLWALNLNRSPLSQE